MSNTKTSQLFLPIDDLTIIIPDGNKLADYFPALQPVLDVDGNVIGSEPSVDKSIYNRIRYNYLSDNPYKYSEKECVDHLARRYPYHGEVASLAGRSFNIFPIVIEDIHGWVALIDYFRGERQTATGRTIDFPEGFLINGVVKIREFHVKGMI